MRTTKQTYYCKKQGCREANVGGEGWFPDLKTQISALKQDAEMDVKNVLDKMWVDAADEEKQEYVNEFEALQEKYIEPQLGMRVRFSTLWLKHMRKAGHKDVSLAPGACDAMVKTTTRWFGNVGFEGPGCIEPDIVAGSLAQEGGIGTIKFVHREVRCVCACFLFRVHMHVLLLLLFSLVILMLIIMV